MANVTAARTLIPRAVIAGVAVICLAASQRPQTLPDPDDRWIEIRSANFTIYTNASAGKARSVARELETLRAVLAQVSAGIKVDIPRRTLIHVFKDEASFRPYVGSVNGKPRNLEGYFIHGFDANYLAMNAKAPGDPRGIWYHEFLHEVLDRNYDGLPLWFDEGMAEFYRTFTCTEKEAEIGRPVQDHILWLRENPLIPLKRLFSITHDAPEYNEENTQGVFYAESWALVHYLMWGDESRRPQVTRFLNLLGSHGDLDASFWEAFQTDYASLEAELRAYIQRRKFSFGRAELEKIQIQPPSEPRNVDRSELLYRLGSLLLGLGQESEGAAEAHFRGALAIQPAHAGALAGLGAIRTRQGRYDEAGTYLQQAVQRDPRDPTLCQLHASNLILQATGGAQEGFTIPEEPSPSAREARTALARCLELQPVSGETLADYGLTFLLLHDSDVGPGVAALEKARWMMPSRDDVTLNLISLYAVQGDRAHAQALIDGPLKVSGRTDLQRRGRDALANLDIEEARRLYQQGEMERSLELLRRTSAAAGDPGMKAHVEGLVAQVAQALARKTEIDAYNAAIDLIRLGEIVAAREQLQNLAGSCKDPEVCEKTKSLLAELDKRN